MKRRSLGAASPLAASLCAAAFLALASPASASEVKLFRLQSQSAFLRGQLDGMSVDSLGTLRLAPKAERLTALAEPFVLSAAPHPDGWVVGTGNSGKVLLVGRDGKVKELFATAEPEVFAVWVDEKGVVYAGSSPNGKVYRFAGGAPADAAKPAAATANPATVWFDPKQTYIWQLLGSGDGDLLVATGTQGKLFRVRPPAKGALAAGEPGKGEVMWDAGDTHVRSLAPLPGGDVLAGTAGEGRIVRLTQKGEARTLFDAVEPEVVAIAVGADGTAWAAAVASEASQVPLVAPAAASAAAGKDQGKAGQQGQQGSQPGEQGDATVEISAAGGAGQPVGTRPPGFGGPRSELLRIDAQGAVTTAARLQDDTVHSLLWLGDRLWVGTGLEGKLFSLRGTDLVLEGDVEERQLMALLPDSDHLAFATTNAAAFYKTDAARRQGGYTSPVLDAQQIARFGSFRWMGEQPPGTTLRFAFRSGIAAEPDATWSPWTPARAAEGSSHEIALAGVPSGRYFQWRLEAKAEGGGASPQLAGAEVSYLQTNLAPRITQLEALDPGQILVAFNFNPGGQSYEPAHPNREGIFTTLEESSEGGDDRLKTLWKQGYRTLRWKAEDPNSDSLSYALSFRPETGGDAAGAASAGQSGGTGTNGHGTNGTDGAARKAANEDAPAGWLPMAADLTDSYYSFDETALPDGVYRFRLAATDGTDERPADALRDARVSEPVVVDHTPPRLVSVRREGDRLLVEVEDAGNPLREASFSVGAAAWQPATPQDGLLDGKREVLAVAAPKGAPLVILRVMDAAFNGITFDLANATASGE